MKKWYVGITRIEGKYKLIAFQSEKLPTPMSHGDIYVGCIGPFRTKRGAMFFEKYGLNNPHCTTVHNAELLSTLLN